MAPHRRGLLHGSQSAAVADMHYWDFSWLSVSSAFYGVFWAWTNANGLSREWLITSDWCLSTPAGA